MEAPLIYLLYGPYEAHGILKHKMQRLRGLIDQLNELNYIVEVIPSPHINRLTVIMADCVVHTCDIRLLLFNTSCDKDSECRTIVDIIENKRNIYNINPNYENISTGMRWMMMMDDRPQKHSSMLDFNIYTPQNTLITDFDQSTLEEGQLPVCDFYGNYRYDFYCSDSDQSTLSDSSRSSGSVSGDSYNDYTVCVEGPCFPSCPPTSEVEIAQPGEFDLCLSTNHDVVRSEELGESNGRMFQLLQTSSNFDEDLKDESDHSIKKKFYRSKEELDMCKQCKNCFCICDY